MVIMSFQYLRLGRGMISFSQTLACIVLSGRLPGQTGNKEHEYFPFLVF